MDLTSTKRTLAGTLLLLLAAFWPGWIGAADGPADPAPIWPLDLPSHFLTSNFMEYRPGRFHAGLDFKTQSRSGFPVRAVEDGWITRVRATPGAYGRAVYLRGQSGHTYVYAHLSRFNDRIRDRLAIPRAETGRYGVRLEFAAGEFPVTQGELLALSGQSGTSGPHLHFEVRDSSQRPLNPQACGFAVSDTIPPVIHHLRALPATADALVAGANDAAICIVPAVTGAERIHLPPLEIFGPVAFSARITDRSDVRNHVLEPELIEVRLDGTVVYRCLNERFAFDEVSQQRLEWLVVPADGERQAIREHWLHRRPGNQLTGRQGGPWYLGDGGGGLAAGTHVLTISARDYAGSTTVVVLPLEVKQSRAEAGEAAVAVDGPWRRDPVELTRGCGEGTSCYRLTPFFEVLPESIPPGVLSILAPESGDPVLARTAVLRAPRLLSEEQRQAALAQGLSGLSGSSGSIPGTEFLAADWPIDAAVNLELFPDGSAEAADAPADTARAGLYRWNDREWVYSGPTLEPASPGQGPRAALSESGFFAGFRDRVAPRIQPGDSPIIVGRARAAGFAGLAMPVWEVFPVSVTDEGSGVVARSLSVQLDGCTLVAEPDLLRDRILVELPDELAPGEHRLTVAVEDAAGNAASRTIVLDCRPDREGGLPGE